jgi:hypothetical protein
MFNNTYPGLDSVNYVKLGLLPLNKIQLSQYEIH